MTGPDYRIAYFGPFRLSPGTRELVRDGDPVLLGDRAFDVLRVLVENAGQVVSQRQLMERVWRDLVVTSGNLRVHMTALRKALDDGDGRYIKNVTGQGYCFVAPVTYASPSPAARSATPAAARSLPLASRRVIGRDDIVRTVAADLRTDRFVTIVGPGGMGKTTVALSVAHAMLDEFAGRVFFVDLGALADPGLVTATVASTLAVLVQSSNPLPPLMSFLQTNRLLIVLDNCEHVVEAVASLSEQIFKEAPGTYILATSREALRVEGERAHWLRPLDFPAPDSTLRAEDALTFPAIKLFVERAAASDASFELTDSNAPIVAEICGRLDGIALAIEVVAGRIGTHGLAGTADLLGKQLGLQWQGRRTSLPRHQTLQSLFDWSYGLLSAAEQQALCRLSIFVGMFTFDAAQAVGSGADLDADQLARAVDQLIAKSLLSSVATPDGATCYRLLETTRLYAAGKLEKSGEADATAEQHARYFLSVLRTDAQGSAQPLVRHDQLGNLRAALEWCLGAQPRNPELGIALAAATTPVLLGLSLWSECRKWTESALAVLPVSANGDKSELVLQEARAMSSLMTVSSDARTAIDRGLEIARRLHETDIRFRLLAALHVYLLRMTDFRAALAVAEEMDAVARESSEVSCKAIAAWMLGSSHFVLGNPVVARKYFEDGFSLPLEAGNRQQLAGMYFRTRALYGLARVLWLCGSPDSALRPARQAIAEAAVTESPVNVSYSLVYNCYVFLWCGELDSAQALIDTVMAQPHWEGRLMWFHVEALALKGELLVRRGHTDEGLNLLRRALADMQAASQKHLMLTVTACWLAEGLLKVGQPGEALDIINDAITHSPSGEASWMAPELLRVRGAVLLSLKNLKDAEQSLRHSLALARHQGAKGWELRTSMTMAEVYAAQGRGREVRGLVANIHGQFTEGFGTPDLMNARRLLQEYEVDTVTETA